MKRVDAAQILSGQNNADGMTPCHCARRLFGLLLGAGPLIACFALGAREWPRIPDEGLLGLTLLTAGENASFQNPTWSPDGRFVAYDLASPAIGATRLSFPAEAEIYVMNLETGAVQQLTDNEMADVQPDWSPDGQHILFVRAEGVAGSPDQAALVLISPDGEGERVVLECRSICGLPAWSPDGRVIAFEMDLAIWTIRADGSDLRQVSGEEATAARDPTWSPEGDRLVYWGTVDVTPTSQAMRGELVVLDLATREEQIVGLGLDPVDPDWSPFGSSILYSNEAGAEEPWTAFVLDLQSGLPNRLISRDLEYDIFDAV